MKKSVHFILMFLLSIILSSCKPTPKDNSIAANITVKWEPVSNFTNEDGVFQAMFILENNSNIEFPDIELRYTTDGSEPNVNSIKYEKTINVEGEVKIKAFDSNGKESRTVIVNF